MCSLKSVVQAGPSLSHPKVRPAAGTVVWVWEREGTGLSRCAFCPGYGLGDHSPCAATIGMAMWFFKKSVDLLGCRMCSFAEEQRLFSVVQGGPDCIAQVMLYSHECSKTLVVLVLFGCPCLDIHKNKHRPFGWNLIHPSLSHFSMGNKNEDSNKRDSMALPPRSSRQQSGSPSEHSVTKGICAAWTLAGLTLWLFIPWCTSCFGAKRSKKLIHMHHRLPSANLLLQCPMYDQCLPSLYPHHADSCDLLSTWRQHCQNCLEEH